jgi:hypothetical protein
MPRHQCLVYKGAPSLQLPALAAVIRRKLEENHRCLYLNSPTMVAGMRSYLAAAGVDVAAETAKTSLVMSSERSHLEDGKRFSVDRMMQLLEEAIEQALKDGYTGLWATGDMTWEFGSEEGSAKLLEYEVRLEEMFHRFPQLAGVCQYHVDTLPEVVACQALATHPSVFVNETLSRFNPHYVRHESLEAYSRKSLEREEFLSEILAGTA